MSAKETASASTVSQDVDDGAALLAMANSHEHQNGSVRREDHNSNEQEEGEGLCARWITTKTTRLVFMLTLILMYFLAEVLVGKELF